MKFQVVLSNLEVFIGSNGKYGIIPKKRTQIRKINDYLKYYESIPGDSEPVFFCTRAQLPQVLRLAGVSEGFIKESEHLI